MLVMPSNSSGWDAGVLYGRFPDRIGHLHSPARIREPKIGVEWALDNGVFGAFTAKAEWKERPFYEFLERFARWGPRFVVVPDSVGDPSRTLEMWGEHRERVARYGVPLAFAVQDGMRVEDVPQDADVIFVGGSTSWKWRSLPMWASEFSRVHVGRVNSRSLLDQAERAGAESCDGTGFLRSPARLQVLVSYLEGKAEHQLGLI